MNYYNEWHKPTAKWLRQLIKDGLIPDGHVDDRSILDVKPEELKGYTQCHFFSGIGGWSHALFLAGIPKEIELWTGSPPCQPFSQAGKQKGKYDDRHLAPVFLNLIKECKPPFVFGEQVEDAIEDGWLDDLQNVLEGQGYGFGASVLPSCVVGSPHKRERLYFGAVGGVVDSYSDEYWDKITGGYGETQVTEIEDRKEKLITGKSLGASEDVLRFWDSGREYLCRDGKRRLLEPSIPLLVDGVSTDVERIRGFGNAIVPPLAAEFIKAFMLSCREVYKN